MIIRRVAAGAVTAFAFIGALAVPAAAQDVAPNSEMGVQVYCVSGVADNKSTTRSQALARSLTWLQGPVPYSMDNCHANQHGNYRTDCSGYVSMIWGLRESYWTGNLHEVTHVIPRAELQPGDALLRLAGNGHEFGHVALFIGWADVAKTQPRVREQASPPGYTAERVWTASYASTYTPVRYDNIVESETTRRSVDGSDISGDGYADLLGVKSDGTLWYYANTNPTGLPFNSGSQIGYGFQNFNWVDGADVSGDGHADLLARKADGTLWYYPNNSGSNAGGAPFVDGRQIGYGFQAFDALDAADINGDGDADLIGRKPDGTLWYYVNSGTANGAMPFNSGKQIGYGFQNFNWIDGADVSGDGHADLLARKSDGTLWYYPNNSGSNAGGVPFVDGTQIGYGFQAFNSINAANVNGTGGADLIARKSDGTLWRYVNSGTANGAPPFNSGTQIGHGFQVFTTIA